MSSDLRGAIVRWRAQRRKLVQLTHALQRLPADQRTIYLLCAAEGRPHPAVAEALGISTAEVQKRLAAALVALAAILDEEERPVVAPDRPSRQPIIEHPFGTA